MIKYNCKRCRGYWQSTVRLVALRALGFPVILQCPDCIKPKERSKWQSMKRKASGSAKHNWTLLSAEVTKSKIEVAMEALESAKPHNLPTQLCCADRKHIQVFSCNKCGKLKRFVEDV